MSVGEGPVEPQPRSRAKRLLAALVIVGSVGVTILLHPKLPDHAGSIGWFVLVFTVANTINVGAIVVASGVLARHAHRNRDDGVLQRLRSFGSMKAWTTDTMRTVADDRVFLAAFRTCTVAAAVGALVPGAAIVVLLPPSAWGLLAVVLLDLIGAMVLRRGVLRRLRAARAEVRATEGRSIDSSASS